MGGGDCGEWECVNGNALIESMDAAGFDASLPRSAEEAACRDEDAPGACLDLRHLPAPEPMERALAAADALAPGESAQVLTPLMPLPLLELLEARGFQVQACWLEDRRGARVTVTRPQA